MHIEGVDLIVAENLQGMVPYFQVSLFLLKLYFKTLFVFGCTGGAQLETCVCSLLLPAEHSVLAGSLKPVAIRGDDSSAPRDNEISNREGKEKVKG